MSRLRVDGDVAPSQDVDPLHPARGPDDPADLVGRGVLEVEHDDDPEPPLVRAVHPEVIGLAGEEPVRDGQEEARAVAGSGVCRDGSSMGDAAERPDRGLDHVPARPALDVRDEADPAGVSLSHPALLHIRSYEKDPRAGGLRR